MSGADRDRDCSSQECSELFRMGELMDKRLKNVAKKEPLPIKNDSEPVYRQLIRMIEERAAMGEVKHGTHLQANNGRDALMDALQESIDLNQYLMQKIAERKHSDITMLDYQDEADKTAQYPGRLNSSGMFYTTMGLTGEAGEFSDKMKKVIRDKSGVIGTDEKMSMLHELGDVLWYVAQNARELGSDLETVAQMNIHKLASRQARNVIGGSGDDR